MMKRIISKCVTAKWPSLFTIPEGANQKININTDINSIHNAISELQRIKDPHLIETINQVIEQLKPLLTNLQQKINDVKM